jgi:RHS repeat-associated protein
MKTNLKSALLLCTALAAPLSPAFAQASPSAFTTGYRFDANHRLVGTISPDPDGAGPLAYAAVRNTYDGAGRLIKVEKGELSSWQSESVAPSAWTGFTILQTIDTTYDAVDHKTKETLSGGGSVQTATQFSYDSLGRLQCTAVRMNPAVFGSLPASACTLGTAGSFGPDRITKNVYDDAGQLLQVREAVGTSDEAAEATYSYTLNGKREYVIDGEGAKARLVYDGHDRLYQWQFPSKTRPASYNDSTPANALATSGSVNTADYEQYGYDAAGNRTSLRKRDGQTVAYTGQLWLPEIGADYYKARIYRPAEGVFMQTDPIGYDGGINLYDYVSDDPIDGTDPSGLGCTGTHIKCEGGIDPSRSGSASGELANQKSARNHAGTIPNPPATLPGGPYTPKSNDGGNRPGSFQGPPREKGPRSQAQWVPPEQEGGPAGSKGYWKVQLPGDKGWQRFNRNLKPISPDQAHPGHGGPSLLNLVKTVGRWAGATLCIVFCESAANAPTMHHEPPKDPLGGL